MATWEAQPYSVTSTRDPQILAEARLYVSPYDDPDDTLQHMMGNLLAQGSIQGAFPDTRLSPATEHFLEVATHLEIDLGHTVLAQWDLFGDIPALTEVLGEHLTMRQKTQFTEAIHGVTDRYGEAGADILLRKLNGESQSRIAADYHLSLASIKHRVRRAQRYFRENLPDADIISALNKTFPHARAHSAYQMTTHIDAINSEVSMLGRRLTDSDLGKLAQMLTLKGCTAEELRLLVAYTNTMTKAEPIPEYKRIDTLAKRLGPQIFATLQNVRLRRAAPRPVSQQVYETSPEATKLLYEVLAMPRQKALSKAQQKDAAKDVELGVYAEKVRDDLLAGRSRESLSAAEVERLELLQEAIAIGQTAIYTLLNTHRRFVELQAFKMAKTQKRWDLRDDIIIAGMQGLLRAVRKYDYQHDKDKRFTGYAAVWIQQTMLRFLYKEIWNVKMAVGVNMLRVVSARSRLEGQQDKRTRNGEVKAAAIADELGLPVAEVEWLLLLHQSVSSGQMLRYGDVGPHAVSADVVSMRSRFVPEVREAFGQVLTGLPQALQILELHFAADMPLEEIAQTLALTEDEAGRTMQTALTALTERLGPDKLVRLLRSTS